MTIPLSATILIGGETWEIRLAEGVDLSIPMTFSSSDPNLYAIPTAEKSPFRIGELVGDTRLGGSCNVETMILTPHCHGTHTECVGHITHERLTVVACAPPALMPCSIISVQPEPFRGARETSRPEILAEQVGITSRTLQPLLKGIESEWLEALIIRTLPNSIEKTHAVYQDNQAPFFSVEAITLLSQVGVRHILVDLPSLDRLHDDGEMAAHRAFWGIPAGSHDTPQDVHLHKTITELIYVPDIVADGRGFVSLQVPHIMSDAAPSRPLFFPAVRKHA